MFQEPARRFFGQRDDHFAQDHGDVGKPVISLANIIQSCLVEQDFLQNKSSHCLGKLGSRLHDSETKRYYFGGEQKIDDFLFVCLYQSPDDSQTGQS